MPSIKTVLFDLDGTLIDSRSDLTDAVNAALRAIGFPEKPESEVVPHVGNGLRLLLSQITGPVSDETLERATESFVAFYDEHCVDKTVLYPGVWDVMQDIHAHHQLGVVTNKPARFAEKILTKLGLGDIISTVVGGDTLPEKKPHPAPVMKAVNDLGGTPADAILIGDGVQDVMAGQAAGILTGVVRYGYGFRAEVLDLKPDFVFNRFHEIKEIVL